MNRRLPNRTWRRASSRSMQSAALKSVEAGKGPLAPDGVTDLSRSDADTTFMRMANSILALAIKKGASDIHIEPQEKDLDRALSH